MREVALKEGGESVADSGMVAGQATTNAPEELSGAFVVGHPHLETLSVMNEQFNEMEHAGFLLGKELIVEPFTDGGIWVFVGERKLRATCAARV